MEWGLYFYLMSFFVKLQEKEVLAIEKYLIFTPQVYMNHLLFVQNTKEIIQEI